MNHFRTSTALAAAALALAVVPGTAQAHQGNHPFENCTEAYENGYSNILEDDEHYGSHLDRDKDGVGCDQPPADFEPAKNTAKDTAKDTADDTAGETAQDTTDDTTDDTDLAATGGNSATPYLAGGGAAVLLTGGGLLIAVRRRRTTQQ